MNYIITGKNFTSSLINGYRELPNFTVLTEDELAASDLKFTEADKIYAPDETSVPILSSKIPVLLNEQLEIIKNKYNCRNLLKDIYPDFYFKTVGLDDISQIKLPENKKFIIKPQKGFFGIGVKEIDSDCDLEKLSSDIKNEMLDNVKFFSEEMFTMDDFIIEEFIEGEEYSFDLFYNETGEPVITSVCHHPEAGRSEYFHILYYTNKDIYDKYNQQVINIFKEFNRTLNLKNMPVHAEFKASNGKLVPIEFNVPRFGGFGLADLPYYGLGLDPYKQFFNNISPDWENVFENRQGKSYGWVLCYNGTGVDVKTHKPDYEALKKDLGKIIHLEKLDCTKNPVFALAYVEMESQEEIDRILKLEFNDYFFPVN